VHNGDGILIDGDKKKTNEMTYLVVLMIWCKMQRYLPKLISGLVLAILPVPGIEVFVRDLANAAGISGRRRNTDAFIGERGDATEKAIGSTKYPSSVAGRC
jgi:hypothetical protein